MRIVVSYGYDTDTRQFYCPASDDDGDALAAPLDPGHAADAATAERAAAGNLWLCDEHAADHAEGFRLAGTTEHTLENVANRTRAALTTRTATEIYDQPPAGGCGNCGSDVGLSLRRGTWMCADCWAEDDADLEGAKDEAPQP